MQRYEVFLKKAGREEFRHAGSLEAPCAETALLLARETHCRRGEGAEMWLINRDHVVVADEADLSVNADKPHRHNNGALVASRRRDTRVALSTSVDDDSSRRQSTENPREDS